jgi:probable rRNA maturation factor
VPSSVLRRAPRAPKLAVPIVRRMADAMLTALGLERAELSVLLTDDRTIHRLNAVHRAKDRPTDVLAFPLDEKSRDPERVLGDVVISLDTAARQAQSRRRELIAEVRFLLAHGLLHLVGHDHATPAQKRKMDLWARRLVQAAPIAPVFSPRPVRSHPGRPPRA